jgi:hypothetical protein
MKTKQYRQRAPGAGRKPLGVERHTITLLSAHAARLREMYPSITRGVRVAVDYFLFWVGGAPVWAGGAPTTTPEFVVGPTARFCRQCGKPLQVQSAASGMEFRSCDTIHDGTLSQFCEHCGKPLKMVRLSEYLTVRGCDCLPTAKPLTIPLDGSGKVGTAPPLEVV